uniref:Transmembrane protein n=1 Tax=Entomoneis paludosa TaxID=265537 RepID=A0A7S3DVR7_9STRA|mmetsp:Transcript_40224/g.83799  ORF Transcript_40224/g.83799 Transcript_40224/m.83799 type:complete len:163 (+) Transcript_40224:38-526(+)
MMPSCSFLFKAWLLAAAAQSLPSVYAFHRTTSAVCIQPRNKLFRPTAFSFRHEIPVVKPTAMYSKIPESSDEEDDGWGAPSSLDDNSEMKYRSASSFIAEEEAQAQQRRQSVPQLRPSNASLEEERDLFIPIFTAVSLAGLFGAYGYEMIRLYLRGELYLPF